MRDEYNEALDILTIDGKGSEEHGGLKLLLNVDKGVIAWKMEPSHNIFKHGHAPAMLSTTFWSFD
jgi:hypothetical protein